MSKDKKNLLTANDLGGKWRIRSKSGAAYIGEISLIFDNALVIDQVNGEKTIIFMDAIESMFEGIISPKMQEEMKEKEVEKEVE
jgi:hypothetical protein